MSRSKTRKFENVVIDNVDDGMSAIASHVYESIVDSGYQFQHKKIRSNRDKVRRTLFRLKRKGKLREKEGKLYVVEDEEE